MLVTAQGGRVRQATTISLATNHCGHHCHDNNCPAHTGGIPLPRWPGSPPAAAAQRGPLRPLLLDQKRAKSTAWLRQRMRREKAD
ncbi:Hypothetical predicted protein [Xyrichtys novacula]|uniref:Uncharacterized protein n=1 Tax=Xyrichtys novacula TaxID=13765 RepID=A0AAV1H6V3_XYRNO|nr:Hypothetical predicted protein [Xyrichtys novacula]